MNKETLKANATQIMHERILPERSKIMAAHYLAEKLFINEVDKAGAPYLGHLQRVTNKLQEKDKPIGWLHDLVEDIKEWDYQDLADIGFDDYIIDGIRAVTKLSEDEPYFDAMVRVGKTPQAIAVKLADLSDNSNLFRLPRLPTDKDFARLRKYCLSYHYLQDIQNEITQPGTPFADWMFTKPAELQDKELLYSNTYNSYQNSAYAVTAAKLTL